jgi:hypothetical protein
MPAGRLEWTLFAAAAAALGVLMATIALQRYDEPSASSHEVAYAPESTLSSLAAVIVLERDATVNEGAALHRLPGGEALRAALEQGYSFRPRDEECMRRMTEAYLELVADVPVHRLVFASGFDRLDGVVDVVEQVVR